MNQSIFFSVGEPSGDIHTARLVEALREIRPDLRFRGFGGEEMEKSGCQIDFRLTQLAVMGLVEVAPKLWQFYDVAKQAEKIFRDEKPSAVVLVDFPGFNWHIAKRARAAGIPVYYYLPPQLWAWAPWRLKKVRKYVDKVLSVLPFEYQWYRDHGIDSVYVGHPFFDAVAQQHLDETTLVSLETIRNQDNRLVAVLPGSRNAEVRGNWPLQLEAIRRLHRLHPNAHFAVACFRDRHCLACRESLNDSDHNLPISFFVGKTSELIEASECAMMVSGSVSLELMARTTPAVVVYRLGRVFHALASRMVKLDSITLPNLIAGETIFPECISVGNPEPAIGTLVESIDQFLGNDVLLASKRRELTALRNQFAMPGASRAAASQIVEFMGANRIKAA